MSTSTYEGLLGVVGLALVALGVYGIIRDKFGAPTSGGAGGVNLSVPLSGLLVILGLVSLGFAGYLTTTVSTKNPVATPSKSSNTYTSSPVVTDSKSPTPTGSPSSTKTLRPTGPSITLTCSLSRKQLAPGMTVQLTYHIQSLTARTVGLGAGLYDEQKNDHSNGDGDVDSTSLPQGQSNPSRPVVIPANLPSGKYELDAEIWPASEIGQENVNDIIDTSCASFNVP